MDSALTTYATLTDDNITDVRIEPCTFADTTLTLTAVTDRAKRYFQDRWGFAVIGMTFRKGAAGEIMYQIESAGLRVS